VDKLRVEGASMISVSPGLNPSIAVFVAEKKVCEVQLSTLPLHCLNSYVRVPPPT